MIKKIKSRNNNYISYIHNKTSSNISVLFCPGFNSDMTGNKAKHIFNWCKMNKVDCVLFDYSGHGKSTGNFVDLGINDWTQDANFILNNIIEKQTIVIGSSMGGWIALNLAIKNPKKIKGIIGIASAPDFTKKLWNKILTKKQKNEINKNNFIKIESNYDTEGYIISKNLIKSGEKFLIENKILKISCPVRLIHGFVDEEVNFEESLNILTKLASKNVELKIIKNGDHRLSRTENIKTILNTLQNLYDELLI